MFPVKFLVSVQGLAAANEICLTDEIYGLPGAGELVAAMQCDARTVQVKGIEREVAVHALRAAGPMQATTTDLQRGPVGEFRDGLLDDRNQSSRGHMEKNAQ